MQEVHIWGDDVCGAIKLSNELFQIICICFS